MTVGANTAVIALSVKADTVYAPSDGIPAFTGDTLFMINGATCNGTDHSGCGDAPATATVGLGPFGVAVDDATETVYVANNADGDLPGTVSVINSATCNGAHTDGCASPFPTVTVGRSPLLVAIDNKTNRVYVTDFSSAGVSVIDGSTCDATVRTGCTTAAPLRPVVSDPFGLAVSEGTNTVYTSDLYGSGSLSVFAGAP